jgi:hypothetical protein
MVIANAIVMAVVVHVIARTSGRALSEAWDSVVTLSRLVISPGASSAGETPPPQVQPTQVTMFDPPWQMADGANPASSWIPLTPREE